MENREYILSIDIGTSSAKAILVSISGKIIKFDTEPYGVIFGNSGKVEQNPKEVFNKIILLINRILLNTNTKPSNLIAIVLDGILHSLIPIDKNDDVLSLALLWADTRSVEQSKKLRNQLDNEEIKIKTGCSIHPLYYLSRLLWFKEKNNSVFNKSFKFISIKEYILKRFTGQYIVDKSTASGTGLFNVHKEKWDNELLKLISIDKNKLSEIREPTHILKILNPFKMEVLYPLEGIPIVIGSSDGPMAHLGSCGLDTNCFSLTVGSSCAMRRLNKKPEVIKGKEAWCYYLANGYWLLGGVAHDGGIIFQWLNENIFSIKDNNTIEFSILNEAIKNTSPGADNLFFLPYLSGERTPNFKPNARGAIYGLSYKHTWKHILRAAMEGTAYRIYTIYNMLSDKKDNKIALSGGVVHQPTWMKIIASFLNKKLILPEIEPVTAWGSFILALEALGLSKLNNVNSFFKYKKYIIPDEKLVLHYEKLKNIYDDLYHKLYY